VQNGSYNRIQRELDVSQFLLCDLRSFLGNILPGRVAMAATC
jgi:hypothetical protein